MTFKDWADLLYKQEDRILYYWKTSTSLNVLALGWILVILGSNNIQFSIWTNLIVTTYYLIGYTFSMQALLNAYQNYDTYFEQALKNPDFKSQSALIKIKDVNIKGRKKMVYILHAIYATMVNILIWFPNLIQNQ